MSVVLDPLCLVHMLAWGPALCGIQRQTGDAQDRVASLRDETLSLSLLPPPPSRNEGSEQQSGPNKRSAA